jgi:hypothetical protein
VANTLAYYDVETIAAIKCFIVQAQYDCAKNATWVKRLLLAWTDEPPPILPNRIGPYPSGLGPWKKQLFILGPML